MAGANQKALPPTNINMRNPQIDIDKREGGRLGHEQLQALEYSNRLIAEHLAMMKDLAAQVDTMVDTFIPVMKLYVENIQTIRKTMTHEVMEILKSSREMRDVSKATPEIIDFVAAVQKLMITLTPDVIAKLRTVIKETP